MLAPALLTLLALTEPVLAEQNSSCWEDLTTTPSTSAGFSPDAFCTRKIAEHLAAVYPDQVQLHVYGYTEEGRQLIALRVTSNVTTDVSWARPVAMFVSRTHGNEHHTERNTLDWLRWLLENPLDDADPDGDHDNDWLLDNRQIWVIPSASPDGHAALDRCVPASGVDPNRDFAFGWEDSTSVAECKGRSGAYPFTAQSTRALANLAEWVGPQIFVDVHGYKTSVDGNQYGSTGLATANIEWNWKIYAPYSEFTWDAGDARYDQNTYPDRSLGDDAGVMLWRDPTNPDSLGELGEVTGVFEDRYYYPYDDTYAHDAIGVNRRGVQVSLLQGHTPPYFWARVGAVSLGYEILFEKVDPLAPWDVLTGQEWFDVEGDVAAAAADARYPFNRLVELAGNPLPTSGTDHQAIGAPRSDLAITRLVDISGGCSQLRTFPKQDVTTYTDMLNGPVSGSHTLRCGVMNWGDQTYAQASEFDVTLTVSDLTSPGSSSSTTWLDRKIAGGGSTSVTLSHDFVEGHDYTVSCNIVNAVETDGDGSIVIHDDQGCEALEAEFGAGDMPDWCEAHSTHWDSVWGANNARSISFTSGIADDTVCRDGTVVATDGYGHVVGHIAAVVVH